MYTYKIIGRSNIGKILLNYLNEDKRFSKDENNNPDVIFIVGSKDNAETFNIENYPSAKIIDISSFQRLNSDTPYTKEKDSISLYAVPHISNIQEYKKYDYFSNPGCSAIGSITALYPIIDVLKEDIILDVKFSKSTITRNSSFNDKEGIMTVIYPFSHQHQKEVNRYFGGKKNIKMIPTIVDVPAGLNINIHAFKKDNYKNESVCKTVSEFYKDKENIMITDKRSYELNDVINTNKVGILIKEDESNVLINIVLDNMTVGGAQTAYKNALKAMGEEK